MYKYYFTFSRCKIINFEKPEIHNKTATTVTDPLMPLLLRRSLTDVFSFCAVCNILEPTTAEKLRLEKDRFVRRRSWYLYAKI